VHFVGHAPPKTILIGRSLCRDWWASAGSPPYLRSRSAKRSAAGAPGLFVRNGALYWLDSGVPKPVSGEVLATIIETYVVTQKVVGTPGQADWTFEYTPYKPSGKDVRSLLTASTLKTGSLIARVHEA